MNYSLVGLLAVLGTLASVGCATPKPGRVGTAERATPTAGPDSSRRASPQPSSMAPLQAAYAAGDYEAVVRRARARLGDSLATAGTIRVQTLLGRAEQARGNHEAALKALRAARTAAYERGRSLVRIDRALGESYVALYRWPSAASALRRVLETRPDDRATRQALAEVYRRSRQWAEARTQYAELVRRDSSNGKWWARLAKAEVELGEIGAAVSHFARAHALLPQSADIALTLSRFYRATMQADAARRVVDTTLTHRPADPRLWRRRADLAFEHDNFDRARRAYERAITHGDSSATPYRRIGMIDVEKQAYGRAVSALRSSFRKDSTSTRTTLYLGISYLRLDSLDRADTYLRRTIDEEAQGPITEALIQRGTLHRRRGNVAPAVHSYKQALQLRPDRTGVYVQLANLYDEYYREKATAARYYRRFLRISDSTQKRLRSYAQDRLRTLRPTLHMQNGRGSSHGDPDG